MEVELTGSESGGAVCCSIEQPYSGGTTILAEQTSASGEDSVVCEATVL